MEPRDCSRVFIVEDSAPIRSRLVELLGEMVGVCVVGEAETPSDAISGIRQTKPHCVILDYQLIGGTGVDVLRALRPTSPDIAFVVLTNHPNAQYRRVCMEAGADSFLDKSTEFEKIQEAVSESILARH